MMLIRLLQNLVAVCCLGFSALIYADSVSDARDLIDSISSTLIDELKSHNAEIKDNPAAVSPYLERILLPHADMGEMSRRVLAQHWSELSDAQKSEFTHEFQTLVIRTYSRTFANYHGQTVSFLPSRPDDQQDDRVQVRSMINQPDGPSVSVDYRLRQNHGKWMVYDMSIDGISVVASYRGQFVPTFESQGFDAMLSDLKKHNSEQLKPGKAS